MPKTAHLLSDGIYRSMGGREKLYSATKTRTCDDQERSVAIKCGLTSGGDLKLRTSIKE
jgi:hypothetical protein